MSFRRNKEAAGEWREWIARHSEALISIGIPREVWAEEMDWWRFVDHGYHPPVPNRRDVRFSADDLTREKQYELYGFLDSILPEQRYGYSLWSVLKARFHPEEEGG